MEDQYIIFDTEYTTWEGAMASNWAEPWQEQEVVQISALKIQDNKIIDKFDCLVRPSKNPLLSEYFTKLTGITNDDVQSEGISFKQAYQNFINFAKGYVCYSNATGKKIDCRSDGDILDINVDLNNIQVTEGLEYKNISPIIYGLADEKNIKLPPLSSGEFVEHLGVDKDVVKVSGLSGAHYALYDCYSLFVSLQYLRNL